MSQDQPTAGDDRFEIEHKLGAGAVGAVYRARDRERQTTVALKTLRLMDAAAIYRFKREFRSLTDLAHPNLVKLYELLYAGDAWFFTMECIDGCNFRDWVRPVDDDDGKVIPLQSSQVSEPGTAPTLTRGTKPRGRLDEGRLRDALEQLAEGLDYLHQAGKLHRDIKPSNVLVSRDGRVALCDFGLVADAEPRPYDRTADKRIVGTPSYMSPEQGRAEPPTEASDWYSVGVMIYEALTGMLPFSGADTSDPILLASAAPPPAPRELSPNAPRDLSDLCMALIERKPEHRPTRGVILRELGVRETAPARPAEQAHAPFVGRARELESLRGALDATRRGAAVIACIHGGSGMGKTALVRHFLDSIADRDDLVILEGRCYEQESVPYKAFDTVVDALTRQLMHLPEDEVESLIPRDILALARLFPVLRRVDAVALPRMPALEPADPAESRRRAFRALRELLARMSERKAVVVSIDDLQWGDADSSALLTEVLRPPATPRMLVIAAYRSEDAETTPFLREFLPAHPKAIDIPIDRLGDEESRALVRALLAGGALRLAQNEQTESMRDAIQRESDGSPFLLTELVWFAARGGSGDATLSDARVTVEEMVDRRIAELPEPARRLLQAVAVAGRPVRQSVAKAAADLHEDPEGAMVTLRTNRLVRTRGVREGDEVECYHDKIRETVTQYLPEVELRGWHRRLATALEAAADGDYEAIASHFHHAGEPKRAARYAISAADQAVEALAFDRAAQLYRFALDTHVDSDRERSRLWARLAHALVQDGRGAEAADAYLNATEHAYAAEALDYQRRAAEQLLMRGHVDDGMRVLGYVLDALGMKIAPTPRRALLALLWRRARLRLRGLKFKRRDPSQITEEELGRIDACRSVGMGLGMVDTIRGMDFQCRSVQLALDAGDLPRVALGLATEAMYSATGGRRSRKRSEELIRRAEALAQEVGEIDRIAFVRGGDALRSFQLGEFRKARELAAECLQMFNDHCTGVQWEIDSASQFLLWALYYLGETREIVARMPELLRVARERGDLFAETCLSTGLPNAAWLIRGDPRGAREAADSTMDRWSNIGWHLQHYWHWVARCQIALYEGDGPGALELVTGTWKTLERSLYLRIQAVVIEANEMRARAAIAAAVADPSRRRSLLRAARADARTLGRQGLPWATASAAGLRAAIADVGGDPDRARRLYGEAEQAFLAAEMSLYAAAVRRRRGALLGGDEGRHIIEEADRAMSAQDIADPARMCSLLVPAVSV